MPSFAAFAGFKPYLVLSRLLQFSRGETPPKDSWLSLCGRGSLVCPWVWGCGGGSGGCIPAPPKSIRQQSCRTAPLFMLIILITSASCLRGRMSFIDGGK